MELGERFLLLFVHPYFVVVSPPVFNDDKLRVLSTFEVAIMAIVLGIIILVDVLVSFFSDISRYYSQAPPCNRVSQSRNSRYDIANIPLIDLSLAIRIMHAATSSCSPNSIPRSVSHCSYSLVLIALLVQLGAT
jgi:hypothetical protein